MALRREIARRRDELWTWVAAAATAAATLSPAQFLRKANYYVVTQAQSVYFSVGGDVKEQKSAKKRCPLPRRFTQSIKRKYSLH